MAEGAVVCFDAQRSSPGNSNGGPVVNPCEEEPDSHLTFHFDSEAHVASVYGTTRRGETTVNVLGLNRHELREYRSQQVHRLAALSRFAKECPQAAALLEEARLNSAEYAAFARAIDRLDAVGANERRGGPS